MTTVTAATRTGILATTLVALASACNAPTVTPPHMPGRAASAVDIGAEPANTEIDLLLSFRLQRMETARTRRDRVTPAEFALAHGPSPSSYADVAAWLEHEGFTIVRRTESRTTLTVRASAALVERTFSTQLRRMRDDDGEFRAPTARFSFPAELATVVQAVVGLDDAGRWFSHMQDPPPADTNFSMGAAKPLDLQVTYKTDLIPQQGEGQTIAILGTGTPPSPAGEIGAYITKYSLPTNQAAQYSQVFLGGPNRDDQAFADSEKIENVLDAEIVFALAPKASVVHVITATNSPGLFGDGIAFIVNNVPHAHAVTVSFGTCERYATYEVLALSALFAQARAEGQQWFFASGDNGTDACRDGTKNGVLTVDWPSSAADVIGVGGTQINDAMLLIESAWGGTAGRGGSGGGQSELIPKPAYQVGVGPYPNDGVRNVPDVAALSGPPYISIEVIGQFGSAQQTPVGGTSAASPMWAAIWSLIDQSKGGQGITNGLERVYELGAMGAGFGFTDIVEGNSTDTTSAGFPALVGYDLATGWGSPHAKELVDNW